MANCLTCETQRPSLSPQYGTIPQSNQSLGKKLIKLDPLHPGKRSHWIRLRLIYILDMSLQCLFTVPQPGPRFRGLIYQHEIPYNIALNQDLLYAKWGILLLQCITLFWSCQPDRALEWPLGDTAEAWGWHPVRIWWLHSSVSLTGRIYGSGKWKWKSIPVITDSNPLGGFNLSTPTYLGSECLEVSKSRIAL